MASGGKRDPELQLAETIAGPDKPISSLSTENGSAPADPVPAAERDLANGTMIGQRYLVERVLGRGGMGTVYLARDMSLGRDVALKLHRAGSGHDRLYREAVAMAQLAHPNVVTVFEVGVVDDQLFVAMEYIRGETLRGWVTQKPRTWREIVALMIDAGEGLAAAHRAGLVHRDFKPENVLVGEDGRPRVSDFGLARVDSVVTASLPPSSTPRARTAPISVTPVPSTGPMTEEGSVIGTPAYMPPEQFVGVDVDPRSDQFSFCVATWEALHGTRPFAGTTVPQLQQAIERGEITIPETSSVPASVQRVLRRGLTARASERWPDMKSLLAALDRTLHPRNTRWIALAGVAVIVGAASIAFAVMRARQPDCSGAGADIDTLIPPGLRAHVVEIATRAGGDAGRRAQNNIAKLVAGYRDAAVFACRASGTHDWSPELAERSKACLFDQANVAAAVLDTSIVTPRRAETLSAEVWGIANVDVCRNVSSIVMRPLRPPELREAIGQARGKLTAAAILAESGDPPAAAKVADEIAASPVGKAPGVAALLLVTRAAIDHAADHVEQAVREATDGYYAAHAEGDKITEIAAIQHLLYWIGTEQENVAAVEPWYRLALSEVDGFATVSQFEAAQMRVALVGVATSRNDLPVAIEQARLATEALANGPPLARATALREYAAALATAGDVNRSIPLYEETIKQISEALGPEDRQIAATYADEALTFSDAGRTDQAVAAAERALELLDKSHVTGIDLAHVQLDLASVLINADKEDRAEQLLRAARPVYEAALGADNTTLATIDSDLALIEGDRGHHDKAIELLRGALAIQNKAIGPDNQETSATLYNLATALRDGGDLPGALEAAKHCAEIRAKSLPNSDAYVLALALQASLENLMKRPDDALRDASIASEIRAPRADFQAVSWIQLEQARAMIALGRDLPTARRMLAAARAAYAEHKNDKRVKEIDELAARIP